MVTKMTSKEHLDEVLASYRECPNPRLVQIMTSLTAHLLAFVEETGLTRDEWMSGIEF